MELLCSSKIKIGIRKRHTKQEKDLIKDLMNEGTFMQVLSLSHTHPYITYADETPDTPRDRECP